MIHSTITMTYMLNILLITWATVETKFRNCPPEDDNLVRESDMQAIIFNMLTYVKKFEKKKSLYKEQREMLKKEHPNTFAKFRKASQRR